MRQSKSERVVVDRELIAALPKSDLHVHLDGSLRLETLIELARERKVVSCRATPRTACSSSSSSAPTRTCPST
jgi:adenosine deaminase